MSEYGEYGDPTPRCSYCGEELAPLSFIQWRGWFLSRRQYCSHKCMSAGEYHIQFLCSICLVPIAFIFTMGVLNDLVILSLPVGPALLFVVVLDIIAFFPIYTAFRGWRVANR